MAALEALSNALAGIGRQYADKKEKDDARDEHLSDVAAERAWIEGRDKQQFSNQEQLLKDQSSAEAERQQKQLDQTYAIELKRAKEKPLVELQAEAQVLGLDPSVPAKDLQAAVANAHAKIAADAELVKNGPNVESVKEQYGQARKDFDAAVATSAKLDSLNPADMVKQAKAEKLSQLIDSIKPAGLSRTAFLSKVGVTEQAIQNAPDTVANNEKLRKVPGAELPLTLLTNPDPNDFKNAETELKRRQAVASQQALFAHQALLEFGKEGARYGATGMFPQVATPAPVVAPTTADTKPNSFFNNQNAPVVAPPDNPIDAADDKNKALNQWWGPRQAIVQDSTEAAKFLDASKQAKPASKSIQSSGVGLGFGFSTGGGSPIVTPGYDVPGYGFMRPDEAKAKMEAAKQLVAFAPSKIQQLDAGVPDHWRSYFGMQPATPIAPIPRPIAPSVAAPDSAPLTGAPGYFNPQVDYQP